jgi:replicative DNA helicase
MVARPERSSTISQRIPPYSDEAERGVLGSILQDFENALEVCCDAEVVAESFYVPGHRVIFEAIASLDARQAAIDLLTVGDELRRQRKLDTVGGEVSLHRIFDATPTAAHVGQYVDILQSNFLRRKLISCVRLIESEAYDGNVDIEEIRSRAEYDIASLEHVKRVKRTPKEMLATKIAEWKQAQVKGCAGLPTGFKILDLYFGGLMDAALYYISGDAKSAKTTLARNIAENIAMRGIPVGVFTLEQTSEQIWGSVAAREAKQSVFFLNQGHRGLQSDLDRVIAVADKVTDWPLDVIDDPQTPITLWSQCRRGVSKKGWKLIVLDYLQALDDDQKHKSLEQEISYFSKTVRNIAKTLRVPFIVINTLSREKNLRGSGMLDYDPWAHIRLAKCKQWPKQLKINVYFESQRFGPPASKEQLLLIGDEQRLTEPKYENGEDEQQYQPELEG